MLLSPCHCAQKRTNAWMIFPANHLDPGIPIAFEDPIFSFWIKFLFLKHSPLLNICLIFGLSLSCVLWVFWVPFYVHFQSFQYSSKLLTAIHWGYSFSWLFSTPVFLVLISMAVFMRMLHRRQSKTLLKSISITASNSYWTTKLGIQSEERMTMELTFFPCEADVYHF